MAFQKGKTNFANAPAGRRQFGSDNFAGICPEAWATLAEANDGHVTSYGNDAWTAEASDLIRDLFETKCEVFFVFNGTAANALALATICQSYHAVVCHEMAHVEMDECGAPEFFSNGAKMLPVAGEDGKLTPTLIERRVRGRSDINHPLPRAVSLAQTTEVGTIYTPDELRAISATAKSLGLKLHMDGARFANAVAALGVKPREITWEAGVDVLCFGATKNGVGLGEAVVFFDPKLAEEFAYRCKQAGQLASKMRFITAPWVGLLRDGAWLRHAAHANAMAERLADGLKQLPGAKLMHPRQANAVFVELPTAAVEGLRERGWFFYSSIVGPGCRLMCAWDTPEADVDAFLSDLKLSLPAN